VPCRYCKGARTARFELRSRCAAAPGATTLVPLGRPLQRSRRCATVTRKQFASHCALQACKRSSSLTPAESDLCGLHRRRPHTNAELASMGWMMLACPPCMHARFCANYVHTLLQGMPVRNARTLAAALALPQLVSLSSMLLAADGTAAYGGLLSMLLAAHVMQDAAHRFHQWEIDKMLQCAPSFAATLAWLQAACNKTAPPCRSRETLETHYRKLGRSDEAAHVRNTRAVTLQVRFARAMLLAAEIVRQPGLPTDYLHMQGTQRPGSHTVRARTEALPTALGTEAGAGALWLEDDARDLAALQECIHAAQERMHAEERGQPRPDSESAVPRSADAEPHACTAALRDGALHPDAPALELHLERAAVVLSTAIAESRDAGRLVLALPRAARRLSPTDAPSCEVALPLQPGQRPHEALIAIVDAAKALLRALEPLKCDRAPLQYHCGVLCYIAARMWARSAAGDCPPDWLRSCTLQEADALRESSLRQAIRHFQSAARLTNPGSVSLRGQCAP
jgi:hypothetical protein